MLSQKIVMTLMKFLSLSQITARSLNKNFDDLQHLLCCTEKKFDIMAISETRITKQVSLLNNFNLRKLIIIVGVICRYPSTDVTGFNCNYLNNLLENISKQQKSIFLRGDFNVNLLNYNEHNQTNEFLDSLVPNKIITTNQNN